MESYTPTCLDLRSSLINLIIHYFTRFDTSFHFLPFTCLPPRTGTDFRIHQKGLDARGNAFASHKYAAKSALRYELGVDILAGNLIWISGP